jgi:hypothetical protein
LIAREWRALTIIQFFLQRQFQFRVEVDLLALWGLRDAHYSLPQVGRRAFHGTMVVQQSLQTHIEMKAALAAMAARQMLLNNRDFIGAQLVIYIKMQTSDGFNAIHTFIHTSQLLLAICVLAGGIPRKLLPGQFHHYNYFCSF